MNVRKPYCHNWYPQKLDEIKLYLDNSKEKVQGSVSCAIVPHAGWIYSGKVAGTVYSQLQECDTIVFVATNHTGLGTGTDLFSTGIWEMPLGTVTVDDQFSAELLMHSNFLKANINAHIYEHAIEVQLPFIQALNSKTKIVPIEMRDYRLEVCQDLGKAIVKSINELLKKNPKEKFCIIASTDMTHCGLPYGQIPPTPMSSDEFAKKQDQIAIERMLDLDSKGLLKIVKENQITMCGSGPAATVIESAHLLGAKKTQLTAYSTSTEVSGKNSEIAVGYAGIIIHI